MASDLLNYPADAVMLERMLFQFLRHATRKRQRRICWADQAPVNNNADYAPAGGIGDICVSMSAGAVTGMYLCTAYTSDSSFTWTDVYSP